MVSFLSSARESKALLSQLVREITMVGSGKETNCGPTGRQGCAPFSIRQYLPKSGTPRGPRMSRRQVYEMHTDCNGMAMRADNTQASLGLAEAGHKPDAWKQAHPAPRRRLGDVPVRRGRSQAADAKGVVMVKKVTE